MNKPKRIGDMLQGSGYKIYTCGIQFEGDMSFRSWNHLFTSIGGLSQSVFFYLGDCINYGEHAYGEKYSQALDLTKYKYGTLKNCAWCCANVPLDVRRSELPFYHHLVVARFPKEKQKELLEIAVKQNMVGKDFREFVANSYPEVERRGKYKKCEKERLVLTYDEYWEAKRKTMKLTPEEEEAYYQFGLEVWNLSRAYNEYKAIA